MPSLSTLRGLSPATSLCWVVAAYGVAWATDRIMPIALGKFLVFLLPLLWVARIGPGRLADRDAVRWVLVAVLGLVWLGLVQMGNPAAVEVGWWRWSGRCLALAAALAIAGGGIQARTHIRTCGVSATLVVAAVIGGTWWQFRTGDWRSSLAGTPFGLGNINVVANTTGPALLAWLALVITVWWQERRPRWWEWLVLPAGLALHYFALYDTHRRGGILAILVAGVWVGLWWLWQWSRRWALIVALVAAGLAAKPIWDEAQETRSLLRDSSRMQMYEAAVSAVARQPLVGYGEEGALRLAVIDTDAARHMTAAGVKAAHIHCEFLDIALAGGLPALGIFLVLLGLSVWRSWRLQDRAVAAAIQAGGAALVVHLVTDNALGFEITAIFCGTLAGLTLVAPLREPQDAPRWMPGVQPLAIVLAAICLWNARWGLTPALAGNGPDILRTCIRESRDPEVVHLCATTALDLKDAHYQARRAQIIALAVQRMGWTDKLAYHTFKDQAENGTPAEVVEASVRYLRFKPFNADAYRYLHQVLSRQPKLAVALPQAFLLRLAWISDRPQAPKPSFIPPRDFEQAIDTFAALHWALAHPGDWPAVLAAEAELFRCYGDITAVAALHQKIIEAAPKGP